MSKLRRRNISSCLWFFFSLVVIVVGALSFCLRFFLLRQVDEIRLVEANQQGGVRVTSLVGKFQTARRVVPHLI